ncbi:MAG: Cof-type HAD-IIB family hydrolase [Chloroflexi bacterium]|nr:Cof-type HAD-IIB family hydrolase [Chloroflexota bacterium]
MAEGPRIRLIAMDLDGTLVKGEQGITPRVRRAIDAARAAGIEVTIATGRMFRSARRFADDLQVTLPIICYQGSLVRDPVTGVTHQHDVLPIEPAQAAVQFARQRGLHVNAYIDDELYMEADTPEGRFYAASSDVPITFVADLAAAVAVGSTKLVFVMDEDRVLDAVAALDEQFGSDVQATRSHPRFAELIRRDVSKGRALARVAEVANVPIEQTMGIGDNLNDLTLVQAAGIGVAMGDADPRVLASADWITGSYEDDGVAQALERLLNGAPA